MESPKSTYKELENKIKKLEFELEQFNNNSELINAKEKAKKNEEYLRTMIEQSPIGTQIYNMEGFVINANQAWADIWNIKDISSVLNQFNILTDPQIEAMGLTKYFKRVFAGEKVDIPEVKFNPDVSGFQGRERYVKLRAYPLKKADGTYDNIIVLNEDISQSKQSELKMKELNDKLALQNEEYLTLNKELTESVERIQNINTELEEAKEKAEESEEQLKLIANNFVNGMIYQVAMLDENKRQFNYVSDAVNKLYGCTADEVKEDPNLIYGKIYKDDVAELILKEKEALKNMSIFKCEARIVKTDGSIRWAYYVSKPRIINGLVCWDGLEVDITERKKNEEELKKAKDKAEESDKLKSAFLANMSHEIRTPMNSILGFSELLNQKDLSDETKEKYIKLINSGGTRLLVLISDIVDVSKIDANQLSLSFDFCCINNIIDNLYNQFSISDLKKEVTLKINKGLKNSESTIKTDENRLIQILSNLIENALKFTKEGEIEFGYTSKQTFLEFYVKDNGIGISPKYHHLVFDRFRQVDDDYFGTGTGLGLSIVKGLVDLFNGEIWVKSEKDKGAIFYFTIPL